MAIRYIDETGQPIIVSGSENTGIPEAPKDSKQYARENGTWTEVIASSGDITSSNDTINDIIYMTEEEYETKLAAGELLPGQIISTEGSEEIGANIATDEEYNAGVITTKSPNVKQVKDTFNDLEIIPEAPSDDVQYARKNQTWTPVESGTSDLILTSPAGVKYQLSVSNMGELTTELLERIARYIAHEGRSGVYATPNTLEAYEVSGALGYWGMECDLRETYDGYFVLAATEQLTIRSGNKLTVDNNNLSTIQREELRPVDGSYDSGVVTSTEIKIPTLEQFVAVCNKYNSVPIVRIRAISAIGKVAEAQAILETEVGDNYIISSEDLDQCKQARTNNANCGVQYIMTTLPDEALLDELAPLKIDLSISYDVIDFDTVAAIKAKNLKVDTGVVDDINQLSVVDKMGINYMTTNYFRDPELFESSAKPNMIVKFENGTRGANTTNTTATGGQDSTVLNKAYTAPFSVLGYTHVRRTDISSGIFATCTCFDGTERRTITVDTAGAEGLQVGADWVKLPENAVSAYLYIGRAMDFTDSNMVSFAVGLEFTSLLGY